MDATGYTALHYAARSGHLIACEQLLNAGADVDACTRSGGVTPLIRAAMMGRFFSNIEPFYENKLNQTSSNSPDFVSGHEKVVELLLRKGANVFHQDNDGNTSLHKAVQNKHEHIVKLILDSSCDAAARLENICNKKGLKAKELPK